MHGNDPSNEAAVQGDDAGEGRRLVARVIVLGGPSGSGKTRLAERLGLPVVPLDEFYKDGDDPTMPRTSGGHLDWESPDSWNCEAAIAALKAICDEGSVDVPTYSYSLNRATGHRTVRLGGSRYVVTEGIFAAEVLDELRSLGLLADAILIDNHRVTTFSRRLRRDLGDRRKPVRDIIRIGARKLRSEAAILRELERAGCAPMSSRAAEARLRSLIATT